MITIRQIAEDPRKALADLEKELRAEPGALLREMSDLAEEAGDWTQHLPYAIAAAYYENPSAQTQYQSHVEHCDYCKGLLETLHPSAVQAEDFAQAATRAQPARAPRRVRAVWVPVTAAASILATGFGSLFVLPGLSEGELFGARAPRHDVTALTHELRTQPSTLLRLEKSDEPRDRYEAARVYFSVDKPQLAWQQIGQGLELAGVHPVDAQKITTAADVPSDKSAQTLSKAAQRLSTLQSSTSPRDRTVYLERAQVQAKLGLNTDALESIQQYLKVTNADSKTLADFSGTVLAKRSKFSDARAMEQAK